MSHTAESTDGMTGSVRYAETTVTGWSGWIFFATCMMVLVGVLHAITGFVAIFKDQYYLVDNTGLVVTVDYTTWGWVHLLGGVVMAVAGAALLTGQMWARVVAVLAALASIVLNFGFLAAYPLWSTIIIAVDVLVIWAVIVHGDELREA
jgi:hypothetical protein